MSNYKIYATLLDTWVRYLNSDIDAESFSNLDEGGTYRLTPDQIADARMEDLLNCINRVPKETTERQALGTAYNSIIDCFIAFNETITSDNFKNFNEFYYRGGTVKIKVGKTVDVNMDGYNFQFDLDDCLSATRDFMGSISQHYCSANLKTQYGDVELYGYADEILRDKVYDIKTTSRYTFGKYENGTQKDLYPYCLVESGEMQTCASFTYSVFVPNSSRGAITMRSYSEEYTYNHEKSTARLRELCEGLIYWIETHRPLITNKKIFGYE